MKLNLHVRRKSRLDMLPLIDVVFLLLVFFIYAMLSMSVHSGVSVALPASASTEIEKELILSVTVKKNGDIYVDKTGTSMEDLGDVLKMKTAGAKDPGVLIFGDGDLSYQRLFKVIDQVRGAGISRVSLQAEVEKP